MARATATHPAHTNGVATLAPARARNGNGAERLAGALRDFLCQDRESIKFVASGSVLMPMLRDTAASPIECVARDDSWWRYPEYVALLLTLMRAEAIDNVVFLAGDIHCSLFAKIGIRRNDGRLLRAWSIVSSGLHAPYRFANTSPDEYVRSHTQIPAGSWVKDMLGDVEWEILDSRDRDAHAVVTIDPARNEPQVEFVLST